MTSHPALALVLAWVLVLGLDRAGVRVGWVRSAPVRALLFAASITVLVVYCGIVIWYASQMTYLDPAEPTITAVAAVFNAGNPLYPALDAADRYAHIYGPVLFMVHGAALAALGPSILASKAVGAAAILASLVLCFYICRARAGAFAALVATSAAALVYLGFGQVTFWTRSDPLLILCATIGLFAARSRSRRATQIVLGAAIGLAVNLKLTGPFYLLPMCAMAASAHGARVLLGTMLVAAPVALAPFLLPQASLRHYWAYFELSARNGLVAATLRQVVEWIVFLCAPLVGVLVSGGTAAALPNGQRGGTVWTTLGAALGVVALAAAKPGGGPFHLLPFVPVLAYALAGVPPVVWKTPALRSLLVAFGVTALAFAVPKQATFIATIAARDLAPAVADVRRFAEAHPGKRVAVGYAGTSYLSHARTEAVFRTGDYLLDAPAVQEHRLSGLPLPHSTMSALEECRITYWLLPSGAEPFAVPSAYRPYGLTEVFPVEFRTAFFRGHVRTGSVGAFDVWLCHSDVRAARAPHR